MGFKTVAPGVLIREDGKRTYKGRPDRYFTIRYRVEGKRYQEALGWASDGWNVAKAQAELARLKAAAVTGDGAVTLRQRREEAQAAREAEQNAPTLQKVWLAYREALEGRIITNYEGYVKNHLSSIMPMKIEALRTAHIDALCKQLRDKHLSDSTIKHCLGLIRQIIFWGAKHGYNEQPPVHLLHFNMPRIDNSVTENLTDEQLASFLAALDEYPDKKLAASMKFALLTGVRRYAMFNLTWGDVNFVNKYICLRGEYAKSGKTEHIPLTSAVEDLLKSIRDSDDGLIFGQTNFQSRAVKRLIEHVRPFLPAGFRPYHGLRHTFASRLASNGVSLFEIQKLLTHGNATMTQRYAHLCNDSLRRAASVVSDILSGRPNDNSSDADNREDVAGLTERRARVQSFKSSVG